MTLKRPWITKGEGVKFGTPETGRRDFGNGGWVEFSYGDPNHSDPLHRSNFVRVGMGGLQYRVAASGNPIIEQGLAQSMQIKHSGNPGPAGRGWRIIRLR